MLTAQYPPFKNDASSLTPQSSLEPLKLIEGFIFIKFMKIINYNLNHL